MLVKAEDDPYVGKVCYAVKCIDVVVGWNNFNAGFSGFNQVRLPGDTEFFPITGMHHANGAEVE